MPTPPGKELETLLAAREGDHDAGRILVERHAGAMVRTACGVLGRYRGTEAEDVVQEAFITALTTPALPTHDVGAWLRAITARKALDFLRRSARSREQPLPEPGTRRSEPVSMPGPEAQIDVLTVRYALAKLTALDRAVLTLVDLEGFSMAETARALGSTIVAVKWRAVRARRRLRRILECGKTAGGLGREKDHV